MHRAPVVGIVVLDGHGVPLPEPLEVAHDLARSPDMHGLHHLVVISEEQFKVTHIRSFTPALGYAGLYFYAVVSAPRLPPTGQVRR